MTTTVIKDTVALKRLQRAIRNGDINEGYGKQVARLTVHTIRNNWSGRYPPASRKGQPPAVRTGNLDRSLKLKRNPNGDYVIEFEGADYWYFLEFGTRKMAARPFIRPAAEAVKQEAERIAGKVTSETIEDAT